MKEKGYKFLWHYNKINKRKQKRQIKANLIHMLDATWNILVCKNYQFDIATIHDCHGIHSCDVKTYFKIVRQVLVNLFLMNNQYYNLLKNMLVYLKEYTNNNEFYKYMMYNYVMHFYRIVFINKWKWWGIKRATYLFIPK
jgi:DNA-directed RNA polymerase